MSKTANETTYVFCLVVRITSVSKQIHGFLPVAMKILLPCNVDILAMDNLRVTQNTKNALRTYQPLILIECIAHCKMTP